MQAISARFNKPKTTTMTLPKLFSFIQSKTTRLKQHLPPMHVKTCQPDYYFGTVDEWIRHITAEYHGTKLKVDLIRANEILQPRLKITA